MSSDKKYMAEQPDYLPDFVDGLDLETKGTDYDAYILSAGTSMICVRKLKLVSSTHLIFNPDEEIQNECRSVTEGTLRWWDDAGKDEWHPSVNARDTTWAGTLSFEKGISILEKHYKQYPRNKEICITMRGPEFDHPIIETAFRLLGKRLPYRFSMLDSDRTAERMSKVLGLPPISQKEIERIAPNSHGRLVLHTAVSDAAKEAYDTARVYHFLWWLRNHGSDKAYEVAKGWAEGKFEEIPFDDETN